MKPASAPCTTRMPTSSQGSRVIAASAWHTANASSARMIIGLCPVRSPSRPHIGVRIIAAIIGPAYTSEDSRPVYWAPAAPSSFWICKGQKGPLISMAPMDTSWIPTSNRSAVSLAAIGVDAQRVAQTSDDIGVTFKQAHAHERLGGPVLFQQGLALGRPALRFDLLAQVVEALADLGGQVIPEQGLGNVEVAGAEQHQFAQMTHEDRMQQLVAHEAG